MTPTQMLLVLEEVIDEIPHVIRGQIEPLLGAMHAGQVTPLDRYLRLKLCVWCMIFSDRFSVVLA